MRESRKKQTFRTMIIDIRKTSYSAKKKLFEKIFKFIEVFYEKWAFFLFLENFRNLCTLY